MRLVQKYPPEIEKGDVVLGYLPPAGSPTMFGYHFTVVEPTRQGREYYFTYEGILGLREGPFHLLGQLLVLKS